MGGIKDVLEPGLIVVLFTTGTLINFRPQPRRHDSSSEPLLRPRSTTSEPEKEETWLTRIFPNNTHFRDNVTSRFLAHFPFLIEILYWNLSYWFYQVSRAITAVAIRNNEAIFEAAKKHALSILSFEKSNHFAIEQLLQAWVLRKIPTIMTVLATIYYSHIIVSVAFIVYTYTFLPRNRFQYIRRSMVVCNILAFIILSAWRVMPPRMLPSSYGFIDVLHPEQGDSGSSWTHNKFQLTIAAMPSLHFGISVLIAYSLARWSPHSWLGVLGMFWPAAMLFTILATANHFVLDAAVGALIPAVAFTVSDIMLILRPLEELGFWVFRTEKPAPADQDPASVVNPGRVWHERYPTAL